MNKFKPFITGTAAYGPFTEKSDIDIVMMYYHADKLKASLEEAGYTIREPNKIINPNYKGFEFDIAGRSFNIICIATRKEYKEWLYATDEMRDVGPYDNREARIKRFTQFRNNYHQ